MSVTSYPPYSSINGFVTPFSGYRVIVTDTNGVPVSNAAITAARVLISDANGLPVHSTTTTTTLGYLDATSSIQTQLDNSKRYQFAWD